MKWFARSPQPKSSVATKVIVLADSFTSFTEPAIGQAAIELLRLAGPHLL